LDGGGVRGIIQVLILREIEKVSGKKIHELFDYVIGTSIGGIIAFSLILLRLSAEDCVRLITEISEKIFPSNVIFRKSSQYLGFTTTDLEDELKKLFGNRHLSYYRGSKCLVAAVALQKSKTENPRPVVFGNYEDSISNIETWKALRATSAAPFYFEEFEDNEFTYVDGGIGRNNPSLVGFLETSYLYPTEEISLFLSIGTGGGTLKDNKFFWSRTAADIKNIALDTENIHTDTSIAVENQGGIYNRFNPSLLKNYGLDDISSIPELKEATENYLKDYKLEIKELCDNLITISENRKKLLKKFG